jgi:hypothetical protein
MNSRDVQDEQAETFEVGPPPPIAPQRPIPVPYPRLCEAGPCRNYHRLEVQLEAQDPGPVRVPPTARVHLPVVGAQILPDGTTVYQPPARFHTEVHHSCYPTVGIELVLGPAPVLECNRWTPYHDMRGPDPWGRDRERFLQSPEGLAYTSEVQRWRAALERAAAAEKEIEDRMAEYEATHQGDKTP